LHYIKAEIYLKNNNNLEAKKVLELLFDNINENEIYTIYYDINDLYLEKLNID